jgi:hypothetical protein
MPGLLVHNFQHLNAKTYEEKTVTTWGVMLSKDTMI